MRDPLDRYYTPPELAARCVGAIRQLAFPSVVMEPATGMGAFARAARDAWPSAYLTENDLDPDATGSGLAQVNRYDFLAGPWFSMANGLVLGNPPFSLAEAFVDQALEIAPRVAFLLPLSFLAGQSRGEKHDRWPLRSAWVLRKRPAFSGPTVGGRQSSSAEYAFFFWDQDRPCSRPDIRWL